jgi:twitching motility two-component system response regulator PilH
MALILIVDDSPTEVHVMKKALEKSGYQTATAQDGAEGVRMAREMTPDLIFMDVVMPHRDGLVTTQMVKAQEDQPAVVVCTTHDDEVLREAAHAAGADAFVLKRDLATEMVTLLPALTLSRQRLAARRGVR